VTKETGDELLREVLEMPDCTSSETLTAEPVPHSLHNQRIQLIKAEEVSCRNDEVALMFRAKRQRTTMRVEWRRLCRFSGSPTPPHTPGTLWRRDALYALNTSAGLRHTGEARRRP
jgi:hypothetical protein